MDNQLVDFFTKYENESINFVKSFNQFRATLRDKVVNLRELIDIRVNTLIISQKLYRESGELYDVLYYDVELDGQIIVLDCFINATTGWNFTIYVRSPGSKDVLIESLNRRKIAYLDSDEKRLKYGKSIEYNESIENVGKVVAELIENIKKT